MSLVVLDLNGVLVDKRWNVKEKKSGGKDFKLEVNVRPGAQKFIENLSKNHTVCIWSSAMKHTIQKILNKVFDSDESINKAVSFILTQKSCTAIDGISKKEFLTDEEYEKYEKKGVPLFMKEISEIHKKFPNKFSKILFVDNSAEKLLKNPKDSYHIVETWKKDSESSETLDDIENYILQYLK
jgi:5'(3')-deoxyribonucleotidase